MIRNRLGQARTPTILAAVVAVAALVAPAIASASHFTDTTVNYLGFLMVGTTGTVVATPTDEANWWKFNVTSGTPVSITVTRTSDTLLPNLRAYQGEVAEGAAPPAVIIDSVTNSSTGVTTIMFTPTFTGVATLQISHWTSDFGSYEVTAATGVTGGSSLPNGSACTTGTQCTSTFCVDGVCCNLACGGGATDDCMVCSVAAGSDSADGVCGSLNSTVAPTVTCRASAAPCDAAEVCVTGDRGCPADAVATAGTECRAAADLCDAAEVCDGTATTCPADAVATAGTECRAAADLCDVAEVCDGTAMTCPADAVAAAATECRAMADLCDVAEACDGTAVTCPADAVAATGTECRAAAGVCDVAEACDGTAVACPADMLMPDGMTCDDSLVCFETDVCASGACVGTALDCDDGDDCTADSCAEPGGCMNTDIAGCCAVAADCDDGDACTTDTCGGGTCSNEGIPGCAGTDAGAGSDGGMTGGDGSVGVDAGGGGTDDGGCSCDVPAQHRSPARGAFVLLGLLGLILVRRRRH